MPTWERLQKRSRLHDDPWIAVNRRGDLSLSRAAIRELGDPEKVEVLYDLQEKLIGLRRANPGSDDAYLVSRGDGFTRVSPKALARLFGLDQLPPRRYKAQMVGDVLTIDLKEAEPLAPAGRAKVTG